MQSAGVVLGLDPPRVLHGEVADGLARLVTFLTGTGRHRVQIIYFFRMQIGSRTPSGIGLGSGSRLRRMRRCLGLSRELWIQNFGILCDSYPAGDASWQMYLMLEARAHAA